MKQVTSTTTLTFYPLVFCDEADGEVTIGKMDSDAYALFPADGAALLQQLCAGLSPQQAHEWYEQRFGEAVDIQDFLTNLEELGFICETTAVAEKERTASSLWMSRLARLLFSAWAYIIYGLLFCYCLYSMIQRPALMPSYRQLFFSQYFVLLELGLTLGQLPGIFFHECYHVLAGRRLGIPARLGLGRRLYFLVFETRLTGLWSVPRRLRYLPFLAGMLADTIWFSLLTLFASTTIDAQGRLSFVGMFCLALAYSTLLRFLWQFYFYLRTDLYYVFTHACGCIDLQRTTRRYLCNLFWRLSGRIERLEDEELWYRKDRLMARWYAPLYVFGNLFSFGVLILVGIPAILHAVSELMAHLYSGSTYPATFWDACLFLAGNAVQFVLVAILFLREQAQR